MPERSIRVGRESGQEVRASEGDAGAVTDRDRWARVAWSQISEPGDPAAGALVQILGAWEAWEWLSAACADAPHAARMLWGLVRERDRNRPGDTGARSEGWASAPAGGRPLGAGPPGADPGRSGAGTDPPPGADAWPDPARDARVIARALDRWTPRLGQDPGLTLAAAERIGAVLLVPGDPGWPGDVNRLGLDTPLCLWVRGADRLDLITRDSAALVGARAATGYGDQVATDLSGGLAEQGVTVVSGGAFGIDAAAHRGTLAAGGRTVALLAGGPDRLNPAGNHDLLCRVIDQGGAVVAESPPGRPPSRSRFLLRNRLIAALSRATVVVEAGWRSGALNTAGHAARLLRPVGAVPGPVTSPASAGCHRLLREQSAVCVTDTGEVLELVRGVGACGPDRPALPAGGGPAQPQGGDLRRPSGDGPAASRSRRARVLDALGHRPVGVPTVARRSGLSLREVESELGLLDLAGLVRRSAQGGWSTGD